MSAPNFAALITGRSIQGLGAGILSTVVPVYQVEIAPAGARGMLAGIEALCMNAGYAVAAWVGYAFFMDAHAEHAWRGPFAVQAAVSLVLVIWTFFLPESPRWLIQHGFKTEGLWTLADLHARGDVTDEGVNHTYYAIVDTLEMGARVGDGVGAVAPWTALRNYPRRTTIGCTSRMFAQLNGINALLHFLPEHLAQAGFSVPQALFFTGCCSLFYSLGTLPAILFIDKLGRRRFLIVGSIALACALTLIGCLQLFVDRMLAFLGGAEGVFIGMCVYLFFFGATYVSSSSLLTLLHLTITFLHRWGPVPWLLSAELFPLRMRAKGMSITTASDWFFELLINLISPPLFALLHGYYYLVLTLFCVISGMYVWLVYIETSGQPLEAIGGMFGDAMPPPRKLELEDAVLEARERRRSVRGRSTVSMGSQVTAVHSHDEGTLHPAAAAPSMAETSQISLAPQAALHPASTGTHPQQLSQTLHPAATEIALHLAIDAQGHGDGGDHGQGWVHIH